MLSKAIRNITFPTKALEYKVISLVSLIGFYLSYKVNGKPLVSCQIQIFEMLVQLAKQCNNMHQGWILWQIATQI